MPTFLLLHTPSVLQAQTHVLRALIPRPLSCPIVLVRASQRATGSRGPSEMTPRQEIFISRVVLSLAAACAIYHLLLAWSWSGNIQGIVVRTEIPLPTPASSNASSTLRVLKPDAAVAAADFDDDVFRDAELFPPVGILRNKTFECSIHPPDGEEGSNWTTFVASHISKKARAGDFFQEVGFIEFFRSHYPRSFVIGVTENNEPTTGLRAVAVEQLHRIHPSSRVFFPFCGYFEGKCSFGNRPLFLAEDAVARIQSSGVHRTNMFYVAPHPGTVLQDWQKLIHNARTLQIDQTVRGSFNDNIIPVSTTPATCDDTKHQHASREILLYSCGSEHAWSHRYKGLRDGLPSLFNALNKSDIDMSDRRSMADYAEGFWRSKFCFVIPGDTTATSQATRAMCAGCVPIFIASDFRDLPFSNILDYSAFSIRLHVNDIFQSADDRARAIKLYMSLNEMVANGTYSELKHNVEVARDFFNYHRFGSRSPYGAALLSMYQDDVNEYQRR